MGGTFASFLDTVQRFGGASDVRLHFEVREGIAWDHLQLRD